MFKPSFPSLSHVPVCFRAGNAPGPPVHVCHGCCADREASIDQGMQWLTSKLLTAIAAPALNKWTKVAPCVRHVAVLQSFCNLVPDACQQLFPPPEEDSGSEDEGQAVGAPVDESKAWRRLARVRVRKACHFLSDKQSNWMTCLWCVLTKPVMRVHFALYKYATWLSERVEGHEVEEDEVDAEELGGEEELRPTSMACFCKASLNPALKALDSMSHLVHQPASFCWDPAVLAFGPVCSWNQERLRITRRTLCMVIGQCWRKLVYPFQQYPWALAPLVDPGATTEEKNACVQTLFSCKDCQLDAFARQLRDTVPAHEVLEPDTLKFLEAVLQRVVPTSTFIERVFARLSQWANVRKGQKPKLSSIAAKHISGRFQQSTELWRKRILKQQQAKKTNIRRPVWARSRTKGKCANGWHVFSQEHMQQNLGRTLEERKKAAQHAWANATSQEKQRYSRLAQARNVAASLAAQQVAAEREAGQPLPAGSPCNIGTPDGFPLARHVVASKQDQLNTMSQQLKDDCNCLQPENATAFVGAPKEPYPLMPICPRDGCMHALPDAGFAVVNSLHDRFWFIVRHHAPKPKAVASEVLLLSLRSEAANVSKDVAVMFHTRRAPWEAALLVLHRVSLPELAQHGVIFSLSFSTSAEQDLGRGKAPVLALVGDRALFVELAQVASDWSFHFLEIGAIVALSRFDVVGTTPFEESSFERKAKEANETSNALQALNHLLGNHKKRPANPQSQNQAKDPKSRAAKRLKASHAPHALSVERQMLGIDSASEHGSGKSEASNTDEEEEEEAAARNIVRPELADYFDPASFARQFGELTKAEPPPVSQAQAPLRIKPACSAEVSGAKATRQRRSEAWGVFHLGPIYSQGVQTGYGAICGLHSNSEDAPGIYCRKALTTCELSEEDCRVRLKRWLLAGLQDSDWPEGQGRSMHLSLGGLRLVDFSAGEPEAALDRQAAAAKNEAANHLWVWPRESHNVLAGRNLHMNHNSLVF